MIAMSIHDSWLALHGKKDTGFMENLVVCFSKIFDYYTFNIIYCWAIFSDLNCKNSCPRATHPEGYLAKYAQTFLNF